MTFKEETDAFVARLIEEQHSLDGMTHDMAREIVEQQRLGNLADAKWFAENWIGTAAQFARNSDYWRDRALVAESKLGSPAVDDNA
jgi:hypothetical protein